MKTSANQKSAPEILRSPLDQMQDAIRRRAEEIYIRNGRIPGRDVENWVQAEQEVLVEAAEHSSRRTAVVVAVDGVQYVGEYEREAAGGYIPGEFAAGDPVPVRFEGDHMFVQRRNGRELKTTLVNKAS